MISSSGSWTQPFSGMGLAMPKAPQGQKRPRDVNQLAKSIVDLATGGADAAEPSMTVKRASKAGAKGGPARAASLTPKQRSEIASLAAQARWKKS